MTVKPGDNAPQIALYDTEKKKRTLEEFHGKNIVLLFFPLAFTSVCTKELCSIRDNIVFYNNTDAQVLGISVDSPYTLAKFKEEQHINFPLLSDFNKEASAAYGSLYDTFSLEMRGVSRRSAFVIDKDGIIRYAQVLENAKDVPDFEAIQTVLTALQEGVKV
jgi:glutaredoxin-dependent peroxiredoxin